MEDTSLSDFLEADDETGEERSDGSTDDDAAPGGREAGEARDVEVQDGRTGEARTAADGPVDSPTSDPDPEQEQVTQEGGDVRVDPDDPTIEPATATSRWRASPTTCESCGVEVRRLWRTDSGMVCPDCVSW